jgi:hypothetical protein
MITTIGISKAVMDPVGRQWVVLTEMPWCQKHSNNL